MGPGLKMYLLLKTGIFQLALLVYQRVLTTETHKSGEPILPDPHGRRNPKLLHRRNPEVRRTSAVEQQRHMAHLARPKLPKTDWMEDLGTSKGLGLGWKKTKGESRK